MPKKLKLFDENVYTPKRKRKTNIQTDPPNPPDPPRPPNPPDPPKPQQDLTDKDGLDMAYANNDDISLLKNTMYISGTKLNRMSDIYMMTLPKSQLYGTLFQQLICINHSCLV